VATPHQLASQAAVDVLHAGGNAVDAAVAAAAVSTVVQPFSSSIGGVGWATVHDAKTRRTEVLQFSGTVPVATDPRLLRADSSGMVDWRHLEATGRELTGSLTPCVARGWHELVSRKGTWPLARVLRPAIELAADGFPMSELLCSVVARNSGRIRRWPSSAAALLPGADLPRPPARLVQRDLARTLSRVAANGPEEMVSGQTADALIAFYRRHGGVLTAGDLNACLPVWREPLVGTFRGHTVHAAPPPFGDLTFLSGLALLEEFGSFDGPDDPGYIHVSIETAKLIAAERIRYLGEGADPEALVALLSPGHLAGLRERIGPRAAPRAAASRQPEDTITLTVVDSEGSAVHLMQTVGYFFGTGAVADGTGVFTNSSMYFAYVDADGANRIVPGAPVEQNPCVAMVFDPQERLRLVMGSPGGKTRVETVRQMIVNVLDYGMNLQQAVDAPRFLTGADGLTVDFESRYGPVNEQLRTALESRGHVVREVEDTFGTGQAVAIDHDSGTRIGAADWRLESVALAY
jgi:gamma-glutamyltranspeptidase/glutathione hydrolase